MDGNIDVVVGKYVHVACVCTCEGICGGGGLCGGDGCGSMCVIDSIMYDMTSSTAR